MASRTIIGLTLSICATGLAALIIQTTLTILSILIAAEKSLDRYVTRTAIASSFLNLVTAMLIIASVGLLFCRSPKLQIRCFRIIGLSVWCSGSVCTLLLFAFTIADSGSNGQFKLHIYYIGVTGLILGTIQLFPQGTFIVLTWPRIERGSLPTIRVTEVEQEQSQLAKRADRSRRLSLVRLTTALKTSRFESSPRPAMDWPGRPAIPLGNSAGSIVRATSSRRNLLPTQPSTPRESRSLQIERSAFGNAEFDQYDGFETWDTSSVEKRFEFQSPFHGQANRAVLETIPGSRPMSLMDPTVSTHSLTSSREVETPLPDSPTCPTVSPLSETCSVNLFAQGRNGCFYGQSHIHPLFRTESPGPRPIPTPGTIILASPHAGRVISPGLVLGPRNMSSPTASPTWSRRESTGGD